MSKRLIRIPASHIAASTEKIINQLANIVLKSGAVSIGYIKQVDGNSVTLKTKRSSILRFELKEINEIIIDIPKDAAIASS